MCISTPMYIYISMYVYKDHVRLGARIAHYNDFIIVCKLNAKIIGSSARLGTRHGQFTSIFSRPDPEETMRERAS